AIWAEHGCPHLVGMLQRWSRRFSGHSVPNTCHKVFSCGNDPSSVWTERSEKNSVIMEQLEFELTRTNIPNLGWSSRKITIRPTSQQPFAIRTKLCMFDIKSEL